MKICDIFLNCVQVYSSNEYPQSLFCVKIRQILYTPILLLVYKRGVNGVKITWVCITSILETDKRCTPKFVIKGVLVNYSIIYLENCRKRL